MEGTSLQLTLAGDQLTAKVDVAFLSGMVTRMQHVTCWVHKICLSGVCFVLKVPFLAPLAMDQPTIQSIARDFAISFVFPYLLCW